MQLPYDRRLRTIDWIHTPILNIVILKKKKSFVSRYAWGIEVENLGNIGLSATANWWTFGTLLRARVFQSRKSSPPPWLLVRFELWKFLVVLNTSPTLKAFDCTKLIWTLGVIYLGTYLVGNHTTLTNWLVSYKCIMTWQILFLYIIYRCFLRIAETQHQMRHNAE